MTGLAGWVILGLACLPIVALGLTQTSGKAPAERKAQ